MRLAEMLRLHLAANNLSQKDAAVAIGISQSTLSRFLAGKQSPDVENFMRIIDWIVYEGTL